MYHVTLAHDGKYLKCSPNSRGYATVQIPKEMRTTGRRGQSYQVHRLVALAFIPNPKNKPCINHKNGIKTDNRIENLEWCTAKENIHHAEKAGLTRHPRGVENGRAKLTVENVHEIRSRYNPACHVSIIRLLAKRYDVSYQMISYVVTRKNWAHV